MFHRTSNKLAFVALILLITSFSNRCEPPWGYKPEHDSIIDPPDPPKILEPMPDTVIWYATIIQVKFNWTLVSDAEHYEIDIDTSNSFDTPTGDRFRVIVQAASPPAVVTNLVGGIFRKHYYRIRAVNRRWKNGSTNWSDIRSFVLRKQQG